MIRKVRRVVQAQLPLVLFVAGCYLLFLGWHWLFSGFIRETLGGLEPEEYQELNPPKITDYEEDVNLKGPDRLWFFKHGTILPTPPTEVPNLWHNASVESDRIVDQLMWTLGGSQKKPKRRSVFGPHYHPKTALKTIFLYNGLMDSGWGTKIPPGQSLFLQQRCPVNLCRLTGSYKNFYRADLVLFRNLYGYIFSPRPPGQLWMMYQLESPENSASSMPSVFNLTASYRHDSDIVTPYGKWVYYDSKVRSLPQVRNYAHGKAGKVAMFVSNCVTANKRLRFAKRLQNFIGVDIFGACGDRNCPRNRQKECFKMLQKDYKFFLAFENSNCRDYITEKFFVNALGNDILPIVMGAHPHDYRRVAPEHSFIHVEDFDGPEMLGEYLQMLDKDDSKYNEYFRWKGTGEFINTFFFCRLCAMAHYAKDWKPGGGIVEDYNQWWRGEGVCTTKLWRNTTDIFANEARQ